MEKQLQQKRAQMAWYASCRDYVMEQQLRDECYALWREIEYLRTEVAARSE
jgi:hypothetical protein